jgi:hypothetical protein
MSHVNARSGIDHPYIGPRRREKGAVIGPEAIEHPPDIGLADARFRYKLRKPQRAADCAAFLVEFGERAEHLRNCQPETRTEVFQDFVGVARQGIGEFADIAVVNQRKAAAGLRAGVAAVLFAGRRRRLAGLLPQPREAVLQHRQLIQFGAAIV